MKRSGFAFCLLMFAIMLIVGSAKAQTTEFTYQGSLQNSSAPANGNFDFEFLLFDAASGGAQIGSTLTRSSVAVANGTFAVKLDFGSQFPGSSRFLEIHVRPTGGGAYTPLAPRQPVSNSPYAVRSLNAASADTATNATNAVNATNAATATNATQLGGVAANQYVLTGDARLSDARQPTAGSTSYIQNTTTWQANTSFNIGGNGTANIFDAFLEYRLSGAPILRRVATSFMAGDQAGANTTTTAFYNSFFGTSAGQNNIAGQSNSFFGYAAGIYNQTGGGNSFFGSNAGSNQTGNNNSIFGSTLLYSTPYRTGDFNSFFGHRAGQLSNGSFNSFFGTGAGFNNDSGSSNTFIGRNSGEANISGSFNITLGEFANFGGASLTNAGAIGSKSFVSQSNSLILGSINGVNGATADTNVGIGTSAPGFKLHVVGKNFRLENNSFPTFSFNFAGGAVDAKKWQNYATTNQLVFSALNDAETFDTDWLRVNRGSGIAVSSVVMPNGNVGIGATAPNAKLQVAGGSVYIQQPNSLIITSPNGACWFITVSNAGALATISVPCP